MSIDLQRIGGFATNIFDEGAAEIPAFDPTSDRLFVVNGHTDGIDILDLSDPDRPTLVGTIALPMGFSPNSVAVSGGLVAVAAGADPITDAGKVFFFDAFFDAGDTALGSVDVGALPDMLTFSPDGTKILVANEGEPDGGVDPDGSVSIITLGTGATLQDKVAGATVATATFDAFDVKENDLRNDGVVIAPGTTASQDLEPEYIALSPDGTTAFVTLQENSALAVVDVATATVKAVLPLGATNHGRDLPALRQFPIDDLPDLGTTAEGQTIKLGGFSGLWFEGTDAVTGKLQFVTVPDRGPNGDPVNVDGDSALERPFLLPDYQARVVRFTVDPATGDTEITEQILLFREDGTTPITGLPNIPGIDEEPVEKQADGTYAFLDYDPFGADLEGVVVAADGSFWMVDEYRPAIYHFAADGVLIDRFVPAGTAVLAGGTEGDFGMETLPEDYASRRPNRGFEAVAYDPEDTGTVYAFIQTPLANPNNATSSGSTVIRILGIDAGTGEPVSEHVYLLEKPGLRDAADGTIDKIGDAVWLGNGRMAVIERGDSLEPTAKKFIFEIDLKVATNLLDPGAPSLPSGTLEQQTADSLAALGIVPVAKIKVLNLPSLVYLPSDKPEGLALLDDGSYAVLNDNDFGLFPGSEQIALGLVTFDGGGNGLDPSDEDSGIKIANWPVYGLFQPDAIASFVIGGKTYLITANEGDLRDDESERIGGLTLDPTAFPDAAMLQDDDALGRLEASTSIGDYDGDGDFDALFAAGSRGFSIWDAVGNLVFSSGDQVEQITALAFPGNFNASNTSNDPDNRSDNKGPEPEGVVVGTVDGTPYAFIGLERIGGVMVYDLSDPAAPTFVQYINPRDVTVDPEDDLAGAGDLGPEGLAFFSAEDSPNGKPLLVVANEISGTTAIFEVNAMPVINEFVANHTGTDTREYVEIFGSPITDYSAYSILQIEGDGSGAGVIDSVFAVGTSDANGFWQTGFLPQDTIENGTMSLLLVRDFTGMEDDDLDTNNDGVLDMTPWSAIADGIAVNDGAADDLTYAMPTLVAGFDGGTFTVGGASRIPNGADTDAPADWARNDFELANIPSGNPGSPVAGEALNTPGAVNALFVPPPVAIPATIAEIQGAAHTSPLLGELVETSGIVTAVDSNGFYVQDPAGDGDLATSDAIFVFTSSAPVVIVGDEVEVEGTVSEFFPGGQSTGNLSTTQIGGGPTVTILSAGNALPAATLVGAAGRIPPTENIDDDAFASFDAATDGIDFFESLEGMLVTAQSLKVIAGTNGFDEIFAVVDNGAGATGLSDRGTLNISPDDFNPERIQIDEDTGVFDFAFPAVNVGDTLGDVNGVIGYNFGNFEIIPTVDFTAAIVPAGLEPETTAIAGTDSRLTIATYNVLNLDPKIEDPALTDTPTNNNNVDDDVGDGRFDAIAQHIVDNLNTPDIIALQEVQDNDGAEITTVTAADVTLQTLVDAITNAGGPTYTFIDNTSIGNGTSGGQPGGNIRTAFLYNDARVDLVMGSVQTIESDAFDGARPPLVATFRFNDQDVTVINNHFSSKGGSAPIFGVEQPFEARQEDPTVNGSLDQRQAQSAAVEMFVGDILAANADANVVGLGDFNEFEFISPLTGLDSSGLTNLTKMLEEDERYSFIFQGNSQSLDHVLVSDALLGSAGDDTLAEVDIVHVNAEFVDTDERASDHDPIVVGLELTSTEPEFFTFQLLHASDLEGSVDAIDNAPNFAAIIEALEEEFTNTAVISAGDNYISGPFFSAAGDVSMRSVFNQVYNDLFGVTTYNDLREGAGRVDISIMNIIGFDASALGNHEFDLGTTQIAEIINDDFRSPAGPAGDRWVGAQFPYLSANLDFSADTNLAPLFTSDVLPTTAFQSGPDQSQANANVKKIAPSAILELNGERIGIVGATTPLLESISSPGLTQVKDPGAGTNDMAALATILQPVIDALTGQGINKIILTTHLQQLALEQQLVPLLNGVDISIAGGSDSILANPDDGLRPGDTAVGPYPVVTTSRDGDPAVIVSTDGEYSYVGRLVVNFDDDGILVDAAGNPIDDVSDLDLGVNGPIATTDDNVDAIWGAEDPFATGTKGELVTRLVDAVNGIVEVQDSNVFGDTEVYFNGRRTDVRTQETNFGNLTADANTWTARQTDPTVLVSIKNGGGIRNPIGAVVESPPGSGNYIEVPPQENPATGKQEGQISQLDIADSLRFNNGLTLLTVTAAQLLQVLEHGVAASGPNMTPGQFPQIGGVNFSFDLSQPAGNRVQSATLVDDAGVVLDVLAADGELVGDPGRAIRIVTLNFLADGGDNYPFDDFIAADPDFANRVNLVVPGVKTGEATFADDGSEQDGLAEYLAAFFPADDDPATPSFSKADTPPAEDERIQNLAARDDGVAEDIEGAVDFYGTDGNDFFRGRSGDETALGLGGDDLLTGGSGNDVLVGGNGNDQLLGGSGNDVLSGGDGDDNANGGSGDDTINTGAGDDQALGGNGNDTIVTGAGDDIADGNDGNDIIDTGDGDDVAKGGLGNDIISTGAGDDTAYGLDGDDTIDTGDGDDIAKGGKGNDTLATGAGDDEVLGGEGNDLLMPGTGSNVIDGGAGTDTADFTDVGDAGLAISVNLNAGTVDYMTPSMLAGRSGYTGTALFTIGDSINGFTPTGVPDGIGAYEVEDGVLRILFNSEVADELGYTYQVNGDVDMKGARVSYLDVDMATLQVLDGGLAYDTVIGYQGTEITNARELGVPLRFEAGNLVFQDRSSGGTLGFDRFCSAVLVEAEEFGEGRGFADRIFFGPQETDNGVYIPIDVDNGVAYVAPALGYSDWENLAAIDTGDENTVGLLLGDDDAPAPMYLYIGEKNAVGDDSFLDRNGLAEGKLYAWVSDTGELDERDFNGNGESLTGSFVELDYYDPTKAGTDGWDVFGYALEDTLLDLANAAGAMTFARVEDVSTNPEDSTEAVFATTGRDSVFGGADTWGTVFIMDVDFSDLSASLEILYDGDRDPEYQLRSGDNLDWADDGLIYVQEDRSADWDSVADINPNEASIIRLDPDAPSSDPDVAGGDPTRVGEIDRSAVVPAGTTDSAAGSLGNWESSGILDISQFFDRPGGSVFVADVQAHGIRDGVIGGNANLVQGGQINVLYGPGVEPFGPPAVDSSSITGVENVLGTRFSDTISGNGADNDVDGGAGDDSLDGGNGDDTLTGGSGNDELIGGNGDDWLAGGTGDDVLSGGGGDDFFVFASGDGTDTVTDFQSGSDLILLTGGLTFDDLDLTPGNGGTTIVEEDGDVLAIVTTTSGAPLGADDFFAIG
jgi:predicted extracellular nuclease/Ca2+-binding RTX toxin-like protein